MGILVFANIRRGTIYIYSVFLLPFWSFTFKIKDVYAYCHAYS